MSPSNVVKLRPEEPDLPPAMAEPLNLGQRSAISAVCSAANRLQRASSGPYITVTNRAQLPHLLKEIGDLAQRAVKECR